MKRKIKKLRKLPEIFEEIEERFALNYQITINLHANTKARLMLSKFSVFALILNFPKKDSETMFNEIFKRLLDNDKKLSSLLKQAKIENLGIKI